MPLQEKVGLVRNRERLARAEGTVVMREAEHGKGVAVEVLRGVARHAGKIDLEDPAAEAVIPEVLHEIIVSAVREARESRLGDAARSFAEHIKLAAENREPAVVERRGRVVDLEPLVEPAARMVPAVLRPERQEPAEEIILDLPAESWCRAVHRHSLYARRPLRKTRRERGDDAPEWRLRPRPPQPARGPAC